MPYLVRFNYSESTSVSEILSQYDANQQIINAIEEKINKSSNYDEYMVWLTIKKANMISKNIESLFGEYTTYSEYIMDYDPKFWIIIEPYITNREIGYKTPLKELYFEVQEAYKSYIDKVTEGQITLAVEEKDIAGGENIDEIATLFNEFMSYYTQIYKQDFNVGYNDPTNNAISLLYATIREDILTNEIETLNIIEKMISNNIYNTGITSFLELSGFTSEISKRIDKSDISLDYGKAYERSNSVYIDIPVLLYKNYYERGYKEMQHSMELIEAVQFN
jgi:hypothetical protein